MKYILLFCIVIIIGCSEKRHQLDLQEKWLDKAIDLMDHAKIEQDAQNYKVADSLYDRAKFFKAKADSIENVRLLTN